MLYQDSATVYKYVSLMQGPYQKVRVLVLLLLVRVYAFRTSGFWGSLLEAPVKI